MNTIHSKNVRGKSGATAGRLLALLTEASDSRGLVQAGLYELAHSLGINIASTHQAICWLRRNNLIEVYKPGRSHVPSVYRVPGKLPLKMRQITRKEYRRPQPAKVLRTKKAA